MIYLDNAATTLHKPPCVIDAVVNAMQTMGNSGRRTELCSRSVDSTWSPGASSPEMAMFSASVELAVKHT